MADHLDLPASAALRRMRALDLGTADLPSMLAEAALPFDQARISDLVKELERRRQLLKTD